MTQVVVAYCWQSCPYEQFLQLYESIVTRSEVSSQWCAKHIIMILPGRSRFQPSFQLATLVLLESTNRSFRQEDVATAFLCLWLRLNVALSYLFDHFCRHTIQNTANLQCSIRKTDILPL